MTKRITAALLALCLALALAACGQGSEPELNIDELGEELYAAGLQNIIDEKQSQLDAWLETQG